MNLRDVVFSLGLLFVVGGVVLIMTSNKRESIVVAGVVMAVAGIVAVCVA